MTEAQRLAATLESDANDHRAVVQSVDGRPEAQQSEGLARDYARALEAIEDYVAEIKRLEQRLREESASRNMVNRHKPEFPADPDGIRDVWYWQGDGSDDLPSMVHQLPVVIRAEQLRELLTDAKAQPEAQQPLTKDQACKLMVDAGLGHLKVSDVVKAARAIEAHHGIGDSREASNGNG
jgi:hypothetical protein